ncbi:MAG: Glutamine-hydrolyzing GMP synthase [Candidatus Nomurabacteria bacterium GW2011_GWB1_37_5]|uniref:GMP synthase (glutamine-hydrolyzing) n=1 Tax=Candidatus Nomurabacteria bacterium GW2011_GWB1_37_5 TaxID=1618742 RepID=A0A0G0JGT3_9BACT|nr:MAG: Glutamine-hydrolyzing GMP synthase [Candidatus Nomurabacteria bacterium GW2011_GWB1_37_5]
MLLIDTYKVKWLTLGEIRTFTIKITQKMTAQILIIDLGSQYTQVIRRSLRYLGYKSEIVSPEESLEWAKQNKPKGIILSGGSASVYDKDAPKPPVKLLGLGIPVLGICYGMQWLAYVHDKKSVHATTEGKSYGPVKIEFPNYTKNYKNKLFFGIAWGLEKAWSSHGDSVKYAPIGFGVTATSNSGKVIEAIENPQMKYWGVQFHPEVEQTEDNNIILKNFTETICGCRKDYSANEMMDQILSATKKALGKNGKAIIGVSGGVDSTTLAAIFAPVLGNRLKAFTIDTGGMRKGEIEQIEQIAKSAKIDLEVLDYSDQFIANVSQTTDAEEKRRKFREVYKMAFYHVARKFHATHVIQGTLATDLIESGASGKSALIKTHHNVGLEFGLKEIMPLADFFKFEVRKLAEEIGLKELISKRQPFPGPGLYLRIVGLPVTRERLEIVRKADQIVKDILISRRLYDQISQTVVGLWSTKTVGVKGDGRVYGYSIVVRTVKTTDFMTTKPFHLPDEVEDEITNELVKNPSIVRVTFDYTPKPPATTEFE